MRRPRYRITLAASMVLVALVAAGLGLVQGLRRRSLALRARAEHHAAQAQWNAGIRWHTRGALSDDERRARDLKMSFQHEMYEYHASLRDKYERAASRPWLPVAPDPPAPYPPILAPPLLDRPGAAPLR